MEVMEVRGVKLGGAFVGRLERVVSYDGSAAWFVYSSSGLSGGVCVGALPGESSESELLEFVSEVFAHV